MPARPQHNNITYMRSYLLNEIPKRLGLLIREGFTWVQLLAYLLVEPALQDLSADD